MRGFPDRFSALGSGFLPLKSEGFRLLWLSSLVWYFARWMDILAFGWLTLQLTNSPWLVALIGFYRNALIPIFAIFAGAIADRFDRRVLIIIAETTNVACMAAIAFLYFSGNLAYWHLAAASLLLGLAWSLEWPCRRALMPDLAGQELMVPAIVLDNISMNVNKVLGPILGGLIVALLGLGGAFAFLAFAYSLGLIPLGLLLRSRFNINKPRAQTVPTLRLIGEGLRFCAGNAPVRGVLLVTVAMNLFAFPYIQILSVFARDILQVGPEGYGIISAGDGLGSLIGAIALLNMKRFGRQGWIFVLGSVGMCLALVLFAFAPFFALSMAFLIIAGIAHAGFSTFQSTIILSAADERMRGRAMGVLTLAIGSSPVGIILIGIIAGVFGAPLAVASMALAGAVAIAGIGALTPGLLAHPEKVAPEDVRREGEPRVARS